MESAPLPSDAPPTSVRTRRIVVAVLVLGLAALRLCQLASVYQETFDYEFHALGTLILDLDRGAFDWEGPTKFAEQYRYGGSGNSTLITQLLGAAFARIFDNSTFALRLTSVCAELFTLGLLASLLLRLAPFPVVALGVLPWFLPVGFVVDWQLFPYCNHTEFLWVPVAMLWLLLHADAERRRWIGVAVAVGLFGCLLYRANLVPWVAFGITGTALLRCRERLQAGAVTLIVLVLLLVLEGAWFGVPERVPDPGSAPLSVATLLDTWRTWMPGGAVRHPRLGVFSLRPLLLVGPGALVVVAIREPRARIAAAFLGLWSVGSFIIASTTPGAVDRYFLQPYYALVLAMIFAAVLARGPARVVGLALCVALAAAALPDNRDRIQPDRWEEARHFDTLRLTGHLGVACARLDELHYYGDMLADDRRSRFVGLLPPPWEEGGRCGHLYGGTTHRQLIDRATQELDRTAFEIALQDAGRGAWVSHGRSVERVAEELGRAGLEPRLARPIVAGAQLEAERWPPQE